MNINLSILNRGQIIHSRYLYHSISSNETHRSIYDIDINSTQLINILQLKVLYSERSRNIQFQNLNLEQ